MIEARVLALSERRSGTSTLLKNLNTMDTFVNTLGALGPLLALVGTYCLILSHSKAHEIEHTIRKGRVAEGTVIQMREDPDHAPTDLAYRGKAPVVEFRTQNGLYQHVSTTYRRHSRYDVGQTVTVHFYTDKSRREMALADDEPGTLPKTLLTWGVALCAVGYPLLLSKLGGLF